jgi:hypothetical protein
VTLGILLLLCEVIKGARPGAKFLTDHLLSLIVFGGAAAEFVLLPQFATSTYFLLVLLALVDFLTSIALRARRGMQPVAVVSRPERREPVVAAEPQFHPTPVPPAAAPATESLPLDRSEPKIVHDEVTPATSSPEVASPELQPDEGAPPAPDARPR